MIGKIDLKRGIGTIKTVLGQFYYSLARVLTQPGRHDLFLSISLVAIVLAPLMAGSTSAQVGISNAQEILCAGSGLNLSQIITIGFGLISGYFILKFVYRTMSGLDKAGSASSSKQSQGKTQAVGGLYSLAAALLPLIVPLLLSTAGINFVTCLMPGSSGGGGGGSAILTPSMHELLNMAVMLI
jgi:hypothetical protein